MKVEPFVVQVLQAIFDDLHKNLARTYRPDKIECAGWDSYGTCQPRKRGGREFLLKPARSANLTDRLFLAKSRGQVT